MDNKKLIRRVPQLLVLAVIGISLYRFGAGWLRAVLLYLAGARWAREMVGGTAITRRVADRFVGGHDADAALDTARDLNRRGMLVTLDYLGENVTSLQDAYDARDQILCLLDRINDSGVEANVSIKLSQLGLNIDNALAHDNVKRILERALQLDNKIRIDMEESRLTQQTLDLYRCLRDEDGFGHRVGIVIQAYLLRSAEDVQQLVEEGAWVRLCKGAYAEPPHVAFAAKADTDANFVTLMQRLLGPEARQRGVHLGVATHDEKMIVATRDFVNEHGIDVKAFEFQMLFGIRRDLQDSLVASGYKMRIYVPYGNAWYPYLVRRLAEHPANLWFFVSNFFRK